MRVKSNGMGLGGKGGGGLVPPGLSLDWRAWFEEYVARHGDPVPWEGRLLFRDGSMHSAENYEGPHWHPPADPGQLEELQLAYWRIRRKEVKRYLEAYKDQLEQLVQSQHRAGEVPLMTRVVRMDEAGNRRGESAAIDMPMLEARLTALEDMQDQADQEVELRVAIRRARRRRELTTTT